MDLYGQQDKSIPQKIIIISLEVVFLFISYWILFQDSSDSLLYKIGIGSTITPIIRRIIIFLFSVVVFFRMTFMMVYFLKRKIPWEESISVPFAFAVYYIGFALLVLKSPEAIGYPDVLGIIVFVAGSFVNTFSELQRHQWKKDPANKGRLYTHGLFRYSMHINYFGDILWVIGYAVVTRNVYAWLIPAGLFLFFVFYNIPKLDQHLSGKYGTAFKQYRDKTKKFIPFIY